MSELQNISFEIIASAGEAKNYAFEALDAAKGKDSEKFYSLLEKADEKIVDAHKLQFDLITAEASGELKDLAFSIIVVHAQDHLMTVMSTIELIRELGLIYLEK